MLAAYRAAEGAFREGFDQVFLEENVFATIAKNAEDSSRHICVVDMGANEAGASMGAGHGIFARAQHLQAFADFRAIGALGVGRGAEKYKDQSEKNRHESLAKRMQGIIQAKNRLM